MPGRRRPVAEQRLALDKYRKELQGEDSKERERLRQEHERLLADYRKELEAKRNTATAAADAEHSQALSATVRFARATGTKWGGKGSQQ
jgi:hypothetical protein